MIIQIDYDGSTAICKVQGCIPSASEPNIDPFEWYNFKDANQFSQIKVLHAFRLIEADWEREKREEKLN